MKKIVLTLIALTLTCTCVFAQTPGEIINKYNTTTNILSIDPTEAMKLEMSIKANGQNIEMKAIILGSKINCDMTMMGQKMKLVSDGTKGWMTIPGQGVVELPEDQIKAQAKQMNPLSSFSFSEDNYTMTMKTDDNHYIIEAIKKTDDTKNPQTIYVNKTTNLIDKILIKAKGLNTETKLSDYKEFDNIKMPTKIATYIDGKKMAEITITNIETNYPAPSFLFSKPE